MHPSPDYIAGLIQFENGVRGIVECGEGAPDVPEVDYWWRKCRIGAHGHGGVRRGPDRRRLAGGHAGLGRADLGAGRMDYAHDMPPYVQEMADWLDDPSRCIPATAKAPTRASRS